MIERIVFDWKRTLLDPERATLLPNARLVLRTLHHQGFDLILIGKGEGDMEDTIDRLGARSFFSAVHFVPQKNDSLFRQYIPAANPETTLAVGDRAQKEIVLAKSLGAKAIWLRAGIFRDELPLPDLQPDEIIYEIGSLLQSTLIQSSLSSLPELTER